MVRNSAGAAAWAPAPGIWLRALAFAALVLALANPRLVEETRETRPDIALLVVDRSDSAVLGPREAQITAAREQIEARWGCKPSEQAALDLVLRAVVIEFANIWFFCDPATRVELRKIIFEVRQRPA